MLATVAYFLGGSLVWFVLVSLMPATDEITRPLLWAQLFVTVGFWIVVAAKGWVLKRRWIAALIPLVPLMLLLIVSFVLD